MTSLQNNFLRFSAHIVPSALKRFWGSRLHGTFSLLFDEISDGTRQATRLRVVQEDTPTDALPFLARQFSVPWLGTETEVDYRLALRAIDGTAGAPGVIINGADSGEPASGFWRRAVERGSPKSVEQALLRAGLVGVVEESADYDPGVPPFFRYRIRLLAFDIADCEPWLYGEAPPYGGGWYYGTKLPAAVVKTVLDVHKFYAPARSRLESIECGPAPGFDDFATLFTAANNEYAATPVFSERDRFQMSVFTGATPLGFSVGCWFKMNSAHNGILVSRMGTNSGISGWSLEVVGDERIIFDAFLASGHLRLDTNSEIIVDGEWHHTLVTTDGTGTFAGTNIYHNGLLAPVTNVFDALSNNTAFDEVPFQVGDRLFDQGNIPFDGHIDDPFFYGKELSAAEVVTIYNAGVVPDLNDVGPRKDLIGYWKMGDGDTHPIIQNRANNPFPSDADISIEMNNGTDNEEIDFGDFPAVNFSNTDKFTLGCWVKVAASVAIQVLMRKATGLGGSQLGWRFEISAGGNILLELRRAGGGARLSARGNGPVLDDNEWHLAMVGYNGDDLSSTMKVWGNGIAENNTTSTAGSPTDFSTAAPLIIGRQGINFANELKGHIMHAFICNDLLTDQEARMVYGNGTPQDLDFVIPGKVVWHAKLGNGDSIGAGNIIDIIAGNNGVYINGDVGDFQSESPTRTTAIDLTMVNMSASDFVNDTP